MEIDNETLLKKPRTKTSQGFETLFVRKFTRWKGNKFHHMYQYVQCNICVLLKLDKKDLKVAKHILVQVLLINITP